MKTASAICLLLGPLYFHTLPAQGRAVVVTLHTNFYYFGPVKEVFAAYPGEDGKLIRHGRYRSWEEGGTAWHDIEYRHGKPHGAMVTFYPNGRKASETFYMDGKPHGLSTRWNRDGAIVAQGTNHHGTNWNGTFVVESRHGIRGRGDEDITFYVLEYREGVASATKPKEAFDDGAKWKPAARTLDQRRLLRWNRYQYDIDSEYPYLKSLPEWSEIPTLLEWINSDKSDAGVEVAYSQLVALSRADFGHPAHAPAGGLPAETLKYHRRQRAEAWNDWWHSVGKVYGERLRTHGRQDPAAWKLVTRQNFRPPDYRMVIPDEWVLRTYYRAGDYFGVQTEAMTLGRTMDRAFFVRGLRQKTGAALEWEEWPIRVEQADDVAFAVAYAIDHPWLLKPEEPRSGKFEGRTLTIYHSRFQYTLADLKGNVWWNVDPRSWHGAERVEDNFMNAGGLGAVCLLLWRTFPEDWPTVGPLRGWTKIKALPPAMLLQLANDLEVKGEILDAMWNSGRWSDALEGLAEFGTAEQIPAISRFEVELPRKLAEVASILDSDPNGEFPRAETRRLLTAAAKAKSRIRARSGSSVD